MVARLKLGILGFDSELATLMAAYTDVHSCNTNTNCWKVRSQCELGASPHYQVACFVRSAMAMSNVMGTVIT